MRILFVSPITPDPKGTGAEQRAFSFLFFYAKNAQVELWYRPSPDSPEISRLRAASKITRSIVPFLPLQIDPRFPAIFEKWKNTISNSNLVHVFRLKMLIEKIDHPRIIWDLDGFPSKFGRDVRKEVKLRVAGDPTSSHLDHINKLATRCSEVFVSSQLEADFLKIDASVVTNCISNPDQDVLRLMDRDLRLLFIGNMNYPPNIEALWEFHQRTLPLLLRSIPDLRIDVVGRRPLTPDAKTILGTIRETGNYNFYFDVESCEPFLSRSALAIAPLKSGNGTRIKIIEAFANHCPVVSTSKGCEGLEVADGHDILIADNPAAFARACEKLLRDKRLRDKLSRRAFRYFKRNHSYGSLEHQLQPLLAEFQRD